MLKIYGLITDENLERYCKSRNYRYFKKEPIEKIGKKYLERNCSSYFGYGDGRLKKETLVERVKESFENLKVNKSDFNIFLTGSASYHHLTYAILRNLGYDFNFKIVSLDNHDDFFSVDSYKDLALTCGNHHVHSLKDMETVEEIVVIRKEKIKYNVIDDVYSFSFFNREENKNKLKVLEEELRGYLNFNSKIYLTIDLDVLSKSVVNTITYENHSQGHMNPEELLNILSLLFKSNDVISMDITGLTTDPKSFLMYDFIIREVKKLKKHNNHRKL